MKFRTLTHVTEPIGSLSQCHRRGRGECAKKWWQNHGRNHLSRVKSVTQRACWSRARRPGRSPRRPGTRDSSSGRSAEGRGASPPGPRRHRRRRRRRPPRSPRGPPTPAPFPGRSSAAGVVPAPTRFKACSTFRARSDKQERRLAVRRRIERGEANVASEESDGEVPGDGIGVRIAGGNDGDGVGVERHASEDRGHFGRRKAAEQHDIRGRR